MAQYADIKSKKIRKALIKLERLGKLEFHDGGKHAAITEPRGEKYPVPLSHNVVNKFIVKGLVNFLVRYKVCTKEEFDNLI